MVRACSVRVVRVTNPNSNNSKQIKINNIYHIENISVYRRNLYVVFMILYMECVSNINTDTCTIFVSKINLSLKMNYEQLTIIQLRLDMVKIRSLKC